MFPGDTHSLVGACGLWTHPLLSCGLGPVELCLPSCPHYLSSLFSHLPHAAGDTCLLTCLDKTSSHMGVSLQSPAPQALHRGYSPLQPPQCISCILDGRLVSAQTVASKSQRRPSLTFSILRETRPLGENGPLLVRLIMAWPLS